MDETVQYCPDDRLSETIAGFGEDSAGDILRISQLSRSYPADPRLHFLLGSMLAGAQRYGEAQTAMQQAVTLAPDYHIARYQLGFLQFTSGEVGGAMASWEPLDQLDETHPLRLFVAGMRHLAQDQFEPALRLFEDGMARNTELPPLNGDIQLLIDKIRETVAAPEAETEEVSAAHWLLRQHDNDRTRH